MIELTNTAPVTLAPGETLLFNMVDLNTNGCTCYRSGTGTIKLSSNGVYEVNFSGNIGGTTAATPVQLSISLGGIVLPQSTMVSVPAAVGDLNNVAKTIYIRNCCGDFDRIAVVNNGTAPVTIGAGATFAAHKVR